ncbi:hypothetical protein BH11PLA2_BH11PLA2_01790 [soil metagenome]
MPHSTPADASKTVDPRPSDPPFLFVTLIAARRSGDRMLEGLARGWLAELGIKVQFANGCDYAARRREVVANG